MHRTCTRPWAIWAALAVLALCLPGPAAARKIKVKLATLAPKGTAFHRILKEMGNEWRELSGGAVELKIFAGGVAGDDADVVRKMRLGTVGAALLTAAGVSTIDKAIHSVAVPLMFKDFDEFDHVFAKMQPSLEKVYAEKGFVVLNWADAGMVRFYTKDEGRTPADLAKMKLFVWAGQDDALNLWKSAGFNPVPLPSTEIGTALQTGLITALPSTSQAVNLMNWYQHVGHMVDVDWAPLVGATVITQGVWDQIDAALRPQLLESARKAGERLRAESRPADAKNVQAMVERGLKVVTVDAETRKAWQTRTEAAWPQVRGTYAPAAAFDEAMGHREAYRKARP
jgi:TRAP-type C4-dicarboxylate transport system substrate-binding protein